MKYPLIFVFCSLVLLSFAVSVSSQSDGFFIIANNDFPVSRLSENEIQNIYLGNITKLQGRKITLTVLPNDPVHASFLKILKRNAFQFRNHWTTKIFSGTGSAPKSFSAPDEMVDFISKTPGAIGYIPSSIQNKETIKRISIDGLAQKQPDG